MYVVWYDKKCFEFECDWWLMEVCSYLRVGPNQKSTFMWVTQDTNPPANKRDSKQVSSAWPWDFLRLFESFWDFLRRSKTFKVTVTVLDAFGEVFEQSRKDNFQTCMTMRGTLSRSKIKFCQRWIFEPKKSVLTQCVLHSPPSSPCPPLSQAPLLFCTFASFLWRPQPPLCLLDTNHPFAY